jgi:hypothetical protein
MVYFLYVSLIYIVAWYIYVGFYIYWDVFSVFVVTMNGGGLPWPQEPGFHPGDLPFAPWLDRAVPRHPDPSIVWNILCFT